MEETALDQAAITIIIAFIILFFAIVVGLQVSPQAGLQEKDNNVVDSEEIEFE